MGRQRAAHLPPAQINQTKLLPAAGPQLHRAIVRPCLATIKRMDYGNKRPRVRVPDAIRLPGRLAESEQQLVTFQSYYMGKCRVRKAIVKYIYLPRPRDRQWGEII